MVHLGDGAYARVESDGTVVLAVNDHRNEVITLEPEVLRRLLRHMDKSLGREIVLNLIVPAEILTPS